MEDQTIVGAVSGEFVTETFDYDGGRQVTVYVPPDPPEAVVFAGDGQFISQWGEVLETADAPSTMIVGVHGLADETPRLHSTRRPCPGTVRGTREVLRRGRPPMDGGAVWSSAARRPHRGVRGLGGRGAGARHRASASRHLRCGLLRLARRGLPTACADAELASARVPRRRTLEPFFLENATRWAAVLRDAGADVVDERARRIARRRVLATRVPADGGVGVRTIPAGRIGNRAICVPASLGPPARAQPR